MAKKTTKIRTMRLAAGLTQQQLADQLGIHFTTLSLCETGARKPSFEVRQKLSEWSARIGQHVPREDW